MEHEDNEEMRELLLPYALGHLEPVERARVQAALDASPELQRELEHVECAGARIIQSVPQVHAPPALKGRVLDAIRTSADRPVTEPVTSIASFRETRRRRFTAATAGAAVLAVACIALGLVAVNLSNDLDHQRARADRLAKSAQRGSELPAGFEGVSSQTVSTSGGLADARGSLVHLGGDKWILLLRGVPRAGLGKSWQVWTKDSNGLVENVAQWVDGDATRVITLDRGDIREVMVSFEPTTRPAPVPSSAPVADVHV
ncbi:MAG: hypothetical protein JWM98_3307 [Thermoleophilia bacterium]|nr:hypothetical protein [Thermoleophilia bacterium]